MPEIKDPQDLVNSKRLLESKRLQASAAAVVLCILLQTARLIVTYFLPTLATTVAEMTADTITYIRDLTAIYVVSETGTSIIRQSNIGKLITNSTSALNSPTSTPPTSEPTLAETLLTGTQPTQTPFPTPTPADQPTPPASFSPENEPALFTSPAGWESGPPKPFNPSLDLSLISPPISPAEAPEFPGDDWPEEGVPTE